MASIFIEGLQVETIIGICEWEREVPQLLVFDIAMQADIGAAARSDDIADALDYAAVAAQAAAFVQASPRLLLESLLGDLGEYLLAQFPPVQSLTLSVRKPQAIADAACAGITTEFTRS